VIMIEARDIIPEAPQPWTILPRITCQ
jgi:hypothetical protein